MDKSALKKVIKPLIKECLKEVLVEEGLIKFINENVSQPRHVNTPESKPVIRKLKDDSIKEKVQSQKQLKESVNFMGFNPFEGTDSLDVIEEKNKQSNGVNINSLLSENVNSWNEQLNILERKKA